MPTLSGLYTTFSGRTLAALDEGNLKLLAKNAPVSPVARLRADADFWLCEDDGVSASRYSCILTPTKDLTTENWQIRKPFKGMG